MPAPATPPSPAGRPAGEALSLVGFPPWCPGTCLTVWFGWKTRRGNASTENKRNARICLYTVPFYHHHERMGFRIIVIIIMTITVSTEVAKMHRGLIPPAGMSEAF